MKPQHGSTHVEGRLDAAWGVAMCRSILSVARVYGVGVRFSAARSALLLAVVLRCSWVDYYFDSWMLLRLLCFLRVKKVEGWIDADVSMG